VNVFLSPDFTEYPVFPTFTFFTALSKVICTAQVVMSTLAVYFKLPLVIVALLDLIGNELVHSLIPIEDPGFTTEKRTNTLTKTSKSILLK